MLFFSISIQAQCSSYKHIRMNVVYKDLDNNMDISHMYKGDVEVKASNGILTKTNYGYSYFCNELGTVIFSIIVDGDLKSSSSFRIKELPKPIFRIDDFHSRIIHKKELSAIKELKGRLQDFDYYVQPVISSFKIKIIKHNDEIKQFTNKGNLFSQEFLLYCISLEKNDVVIFSDIIYNYVYFPGEKKEKILKTGISESVIYIVN